MSRLESTARHRAVTVVGGAPAWTVGIACTVMVADCVPVLFATTDGRAVAAAHAGWRGLAGAGGAGILEAVCGRLQRAHGAPAEDILAWLGPCIGPGAFEVGAEVKQAFEAGLRYVYLPTVPRHSARRSALKHMVDTFFEGSTTKAVAALLGGEASRVSEEDLSRIEDLVKNARIEELARNARSERR